MRKTTAKKTVEKSKALYVSRCRQRQKRQGFRRIEIAIKEKDAGLLKSIVSTLRADGPEAERLRQKIQPEIFSAKAKTGAELAALFKNLAPLADEIDIAKRNSIPRPIVELD